MLKPFPDIMLVKVSMPRHSSHKLNLSLISNSERF
jgi:hypothetical protein